MAKKKKLPEVQFTFNQRRVFELGLDKKLKFNKPEDHALRKLLNVFPELEIVAEFRFDQGVADACAEIFRANLSLRRAITKYQEKQKCPPKPT